MDSNIFSTRSLLEKRSRLRERSLGGLESALKSLGMGPPDAPVKARARKVAPLLSALAASGAVAGGGYSGLSSLDPEDRKELAQFIQSGDYSPINTTTTTKVRTQPEPPWTSQRDLGEGVEGPEELPVHGPARPPHWTDEAYL